MMAEPGWVTGRWVQPSAGAAAARNGMRWSCDGAPLRSPRSTSNGAPRKGVAATYDTAQPLGVGDGIRGGNLLGGAGVWCATAGSLC